jgi:hypothetical protein
MGAWAAANSPLHDAVLALCLDRVGKGNGTKQEPRHDRWNAPHLLDSQLYCRIDRSRDANGAKQ